MNRTMILVVDDDPRIVRFVSANLKAEGYEVASASDGRTALEVIAQQEPALVILDMAMPELDGPGVLDRLRLESPTPVIVLSALGRDQDKVRALDLGADDYLTKPFNVDELLARTRAVLRRARRETLPETLATFVSGPLVIDFAGRRVTLHGEPVHLTPTEFALLHELAVNAGKLLTPASLLERVWGADRRNDVQLLRVFVGHLRRKIEPDPGNPQFILTEPWAGYLFRRPA